MKNNRFWNWVRNEETGASEMYLYGAIAESTWFEDDVTPAMFRSELQKHSGDVTVFINSPGGDVFAASQIYTMLRNHSGKVTVKIDIIDNRCTLALEKFVQLQIGLCVNGVS